jgi:hypothetical protein
MVAVALVLPAGHQYPGAQGPLQAVVVAPVDAPKVPAGQGAVQAAVVRAVTAPNTPAGQLVHVAAPPGLYVPKGHAAAAPLVDPAGQAYPGAQDPVQDAVPSAGVDPNSPAGHREQALAPGPLYDPGPQGSAVAMVEPALQAYPALHRPEQEADVRPGDVP